MEFQENTKSEQNLNAVKQKFEISKCFKGSECRRIMVAEVDLLKSNFDIAFFFTVCIACTDRLI